MIELGKGTPRIADKMTDNYLYLGLLAILFPYATFIHSRRDLRDVAVSCWINNFRGIRWTNDVQHLAHCFGQYLRLMNHWETTLPATIHVVDYEETVEDLETVARRLVAACGLDSGTSVPRVPSDQGAHPNRKPFPGATADLSTVGWSLESLRGRAERPVRGCCRGDILRQRPRGSICTRFGSSPITVRAVTEAPTTAVPLATQAVRPPLSFANPPC